ncbi:MAG: T9SS type A sorting domain-containing protein [Bacteroidota bacterium]|nr:T9SS type A sorting domain-containing protein [Bacteroidota bacterium]
MEITTKNTLRDCQLTNFSIEYCALVTVTPPTLQINKPLILDIGATKGIDNNLLLTQDVDNTPDQLIYTLVSIPSTGKLFLNSQELTYGSTFTQKDIDENKLSYQHNGSNNLTDGFNFIVHDGTGGWFGTDFFRILIGPVSTKDQTETLDFNLHPNPSNGKLIIELNKHLDREYKISLSDINGKVLLRTDSGKNKSKEIDLGDFQNGMYFIKIESGKFSSIKKLILQK